MQLKRLAILFLPLLATSAIGALAACGSSSAIEDDFGKSSSGDNGTSSGETGDASDVGSSSGDVGSSSGAAPRNYGGVTVMQIATETPDGEPSFQQSTSAFFSTNPTAPSPIPNCTVSQIDGCSINDCVLSGSPGGTNNGESPAPPHPHAGAIRIEGLRTLTLSPDQGGSYALTTSDEAIWGDGTLTISAEGGEVPAFEGTLPRLPTITFTEFAPTTIAHDEPIPLQWTGGSQDVRLGVNGSAFIPSERAVSFYCTFPSTMHEVSIPASVINTLPAGTGSFTVGVSASSQLELEDWSIGLNVGHTLRSQVITVTE